MEQWQVDGCDEEEVLMPVLAVGAENADRHAEQIRQRPWKSDRPREPDDRRPLGPLAQKLALVWRLGRSVDEKSSAIAGAEGMNRLSAPRLRDLGEGGGNRGSRGLGRRSHRTVESRFEGHPHQAGLPAEARRTPLARVLHNLVHIGFASRVLRWLRRLIAPGHI